MKKDKVLTIILLMSLIIFFIFVHIKNSDSIENILNKDWFRYDSSKGTYEILNIKNGKISFKGTDKFYKCSKYSYNESNKIISLDCDINIKILDFNKDKLVLNINNEEYTFFKNKNESYNSEFYKYYGLSESKFKEETSHIKELRSIPFSNFDNIINTNNTVTLIYSDKCINKECFIFDKIFEIWISKSENVYSLNTTNLNKKEIIQLENLNENIIDNNYPILIINEKGNIKIEEIICSGFDCSKYEDIIKNIS